MSTQIPSVPCLTSIEKFRVCRSRMYVFSITLHTICLSVICWFVFLSISLYNLLRDMLWYLYLLNHANPLLFLFTENKDVENLGRDNQVESVAW